MDSKGKKKIMIVFGEKKAAIVSDRRLAYANEANYFFKRSDILNSSLIAIILFPFVLGGVTPVFVPFSFFFFLN